MKGILFFAGSLLRWPPQKPKEFLWFHSYIILLYCLFYFFQVSGLFFIIGVFAPLFYLIARGIPLDCLHYPAVVRREFTVE